MGGVTYGTSVESGINVAPGIKKGDLFEGQITFVNPKGVLVQIGFDTGANANGQISITTIL